MVNVGRYTIHGWYGSWFDIGRNILLGFCSKHLFCSQIQGGFWWFVGKALSLLHTPCSMSSPPELRIVLWDIWKRKQFILTLKCWRWSMKVAWICCLVWEAWLSTRGNFISHLLAILVLDLKIEYVDIRKIHLINLHQLLPSLTIVAEDEFCICLLSTKYSGSSKTYPGPLNGANCFSTYRFFLIHLGGFGGFEVSVFPACFSW